MRRESLSVVDRIKEWLKELEGKGRPVEVISFFNELPVRCKVRLLEVGDKFVQWESTPKLQLAAEDSGKLYVKFNDPLHGAERILGADVVYQGSSLIETTIPRPQEAAFFRRESLRVRVSDTLPVRASIEGKNFPVIVRDISEGGVGLIVPKGTLNFGEKLNLNLELPFGSLALKGEVVSVEPYGDGEKVGVKFLKPTQSDRSLINRYVMARQREILNKIRLFTE